MISTLNFGIFRIIEINFNFKFCPSLLHGLIIYIINKAKHVCGCIWVRVGVCGFVWVLVWVCLYISIGQFLKKVVSYRYIVNNIFNLEIKKLKYMKQKFTELNYQGTHSNLTLIVTAILGLSEMIFFELFLFKQKNLFI